MCNAMTLITMCDLLKFIQHWKIYKGIRVIILYWVSSQFYLFQKPESVTCNMENVKSEENINNG